MADGLELFFIGFFHGFDEFEFFSAGFHHQFHKGITGPGGGRGAKDFNGHGGKFRIHVFPGLIGIGHHRRGSVGVGNLGCQGKEEVFPGQVELFGFFGIGDDNAVITDLDFNDLIDPVFHGRLDFGLLDSPGRIGDVRVLDSHTGAKEFVPPAGPGGFDFRGLEFGGFSKIFSHYRGKGVNG